MNKIGKKTIIAIILANCFLILAAICGKILSRFDYEDHLDEAVVSVDDASITLREFGYYIYEVEAFVQNQALLYDPENPKLWWNTHFSAGLDSQFVCDYAKKVAIFLITTQNLSGYHDDPPKLVNWDGAYYQEKILPEHQIRNNDEVLDNITLGKITVNME